MPKRELRGSEAAVLHPVQPPKLGRFESLNLFLARGTSEAKLTLIEYAAWTCLWAAERNGLVAISFSQITRETPLCLRAAKKAVASLQKKGLVKIAKRGDINGHVNRYILSPYPGAPCALDLVHQEVKPSAPCAPFQKEGLSPSFQNGPADARHGSRSSGPQPENPDGATIPYSPLPTEAECRELARSWMGRASTKGQGRLQAMARLNALTATWDETRKHWVSDEIAKFCGGWAP